MSAINQEFKLALKHHQKGEYQLAANLYEKIKNTDPNFSEVDFLLGLLMTQVNRPDQAINHLNSYLSSKPGDTKAISILGLAHYDLKNFEEAYKNFKLAINEENPSSSLLYNLGQTCFKLSKFEEAIEANKKALEIEPRYTLAQIGLGICLKELKRYEEARHFLEKATTLEPSNSEAYFFLGNVLRDLSEFKASTDCYKRALELNPNYLAAAVNCGNSLKDLGFSKKSIDYYDIALRIDKSHPEANYNKSLALLNDGQWKEGWPLYEWRFNSSEAQTKFVQQPLIENIDIWNGETLHGNLLVLPEQGIGDQVFFLGMLPDLQQKAKSLTVGADCRLTPLLKRTYPEIDFIQNTSDVDTSRVNAQIHMGSLGQYLRRNEKSFSSVVSPYLMADKLQSAALRQSMQADGKLLCGISWLSKNADHGNAKSLSLTALENALTLPGFDFVDLQYGDTQHEREQFHADHGVHVIKRDEIDNFKDIDGLASLIDACDLVITVSNTTAHLACALGKPTLVLLPQSSAVFWYWHRKGMQSPWYPTAVMLRQEELGGWPQVVGTVRHILQGMQ